MPRLSFIIIIIPLWLTGCQKHDQANSTATVSQKAIPIKTTKLTLQTTASDISISGNIEGDQTVRLGFMVAGKINKIAPKEGQVVSKGQLIASLDPTNYQIAKDLADIQVNATTDEFNRLKVMRERNSVSESDFSKIGFGLQQAQAQQRLQAKNLADTRLYAPFSGILLKKLAEEGEIIGVGTPILVLSDISKVKVSAYIPEGELHRIKIGQNANVTISALEQTFVGKIIEVGSAADVASRAFTVKIELPNPAKRIRPGMIAEIKITSSQTNHVLALPAEAVLHGLDNQSFVYVADTKEGKAFKRQVSLGNLYDNQITILSGLNEGEAVVTAGQHKLTDGAPITIQN